MSVTSVFTLSASLLEVRPYTAKASQHDGAIRAALEKAGRPSA